MIRVRGLKLVDNDPRAQAWAPRTARIPLERVIAERLVSRGEPGMQSRRHRPRWKRRETGPLMPTARHAIRALTGRVLHFDGFLIARSFHELTAFLLERYVVEPGNAVGRWLAGRPLNEATVMELVRALVEHLAAHARHDASSEFESGPLGIVFRSDFDMTSVSVTTVRTDKWILDVGDRCGVVLSAVQNVQIDGHAVPTQVFARLHAEPDEPVDWFDGRRHGLASDSSFIPTTLQMHLRKHGVAIGFRHEHVYPLADLSPMFLVRVPGRNKACRAASGIPAGAEGPAILLPTSAPVPLQDPRGKPLDLPVIADPAAAMAVLGRTGGGNVYNPGNTLLDVRDVPLPDKPTWKVGVLPFGRPQ